MTRILRFLMIAAVAWPFLGGTAAAQEMARTANDVPDANILVEEIDGNSVPYHENNKKTHFLEALALKMKVTEIAKNSRDVKKQDVQDSKAEVKNDPLKKFGKPGRATAPMLKAIRPMTNITDGSALIVLVANDVWGDGSGYQMLIDADATMYASWSSNGFTQNIYNMAEYTIPENADYNASGNVTNFLVGEIGQVVVPAGTYDILIANPTPGDKIYAATDGRIDNYSIAAGNVYTFTVSRNGNNDQTNVEISSLADYLEQPINLAANPATTSAEVTWESGYNNENWNLRYRPYVQEVECNRFWSFPIEGQYVTTDGWILHDSDGDNYNWGFSATNGDSENNIPATDACLFSSSWKSGGVGALSPDNWAVSPEVTLGGTLKFRAMTNGYDDKLGVFVYQGSLNSVAVSDLVQVGSDFVPNKNREFTEYEFDLSGFSGTGYIIIRHYNCSDEYNVYVDDIQLIAPGNKEIPNWVYVNGVSSPHNILGLTTGTTYEVQVQGVGLNATTDWTSSVLFTPYDFPERDIAINDKDFFESEAMSYTWVDDNGDTHKSYLADPATDPNQMIAMVTKIYTDPRVPGNLKRGFDVSGNLETTNNDVYYTGVGGLKYVGPSSGSERYLNANNYEFEDIYGWGITGTVGATGTKTLNTTGSSGTQTEYYAYMTLDQYKPNDEGLTMLLVELKDTYVDGSNDDIENDESFDGNEPARLKAYFANTIKSIQVLTESKRTGRGLDKGTLFKIDCNKMNKFFLLAKGQLHLDHNTGGYTRNITWITSGSADKDYCIPPHAAHFNARDFFMDRNTAALFYHMFEQFSPSMFNDSIGATDLYQKMVTEMKTFPVIHDCLGITDMNHQFLMYGPDSPDHDCQDIRDFMFFVPDYRMLDNGNRDPGVHLQQFLNYNTAHQPTAGVFVIKQYPITGEQISGQETYKLHLTWDSNLLKFLPGEEGQYTLYRVITNADGTKTYQAVGEFDPNTFEYYDNVPMQKNGQQVTYVVQGQDVGKFLSLQMSNEESYIIPGLDREEQLRIALNNDYYFSRYDAATQTNNYSNSVIANNTVGTNVKPSYLQNAVAGSDVGKFKFWRATVNEVNGEMVVDTENAVNFVTAWVSNYNSATGGTLTYRDWTDQTDFSSKYYGHGYHQNPTSSTFSIVDGEVVFNGLKLYDNFSVSVEENSHPALYVYYVTLETAVPFDLNAQGTETSTHARSNTVNVPVYKTEMAMNPISAQDVEADVTHQFPAATKFDVNARYSSRSEILGYYIYRWADGETAAVDRSIYEDDGADASPQGQAGNQGEYYTVAMNTDFTGRTENFGANYADVTASFEDNYVNKAQVADTYTYAPVVELFAPIQAVELPSGADRVDYNTYGGPQQMSAGGLVDVDVVKYAPSSYSWNADGQDYRYYNVNLRVNPNKEIVPEGYQIAKVRVWRKIASKYLGEQAATQNTPDYTGRLNLDVNGEYMFVNKTDCQKGEELGAELLGTSGNNGPVYSGTFGAVALEQGDEIPMSFVVRVYFTKSQPAGSPMLKAEGDQRYYIAETVVEDKLTYEIPTGIDGVGVMNNVASVKYYNAAGIESDKPFQGVNIVVTRYNDGPTTTTKILK